MQFKNNDYRFGFVAKTFHWLLFVMLLLAMVFGNIDADMEPGPEKFEAITAHKAFGVLVLIMVLARLAWRLINPLPRSVNQGWQEHLSSWLHRLLYVLMFAQPITGILMSQAAGYPVSFYGLFEVPTFVAEDKELATGLFHELHEWIWRLLALSVIIHVAAAFYHHFLLKDDVLKRMSFGQVKVD